jgi:chemotaxis protein methyltransferase CheR
MIVTQTTAPKLTAQEFIRFQKFIFDAAGITLPDNKITLVSTRLTARVQQCAMRTFGDYLNFVVSGAQPQERQTAIDLLTTNETYFFREPRHFEFLREQLTALAARPRVRPLRVWSAAGSTGEEAYSIAMLLEDQLRGRPWEVLATDISARVLERARAGKFPMDRARNVPLEYLRRFCLDGRGSYENTLLIEPGLRNKVKFRQVNLNSRLPEIGRFDFIFLRNVLIYFNHETKRAVVGRVADILNPGGWLLVGLAENLNNVCETVKYDSPSIYRKT